MKGKRVLGAIILLGYLLSQLLSYLGYVERNRVAAADNNKNTSTQLVAVLVDDKIYPDIENDLKRYATQYIQKKYPLSKALVLKINTQEYDAPEITKLLENLYFDGIKDESSRLIGLVMIGEIPLPVVKYDDYIFPSVYPYVDFLEQKYIWNESAGYFVKNADNGQAEVWHGMIDFGSEIQSYHKFFAKLKSYEADPTTFVDKKIWYDDFIALKNNFLTENFNAYQNKLIFAEDLGYHRYTNFLVNLLEGKEQEDHKEVFEELSEALSSLNLGNGNLQDSLTALNNQKSNHTPTKLLEQKIQSFLKDYYELLSTPLTHTIAENVKASNRREISEGHQQKIQIKDQMLLGKRDADGIIKTVNDKLEAFVDQKVEKEKYAMKTVIPTYYHITQDEKKSFLGFKYYLPKIHDTFQFFYFGKNAQTISNAEDFSIFRGTYRNLTGLVNYSTIIKDPLNPAKTSADSTDLSKKGVGASYDIFSTQVEANRGFNIFNMEDEYQLYEKEKVHAKIETHCVRRRFGLKWKWVPCAVTKRAPVGKCNPNSEDRKDHADCENFEQFGQRVWGGASPLNMDAEKFQNQIYTFKGGYDPKSAWQWIFDIAGSIPIKQESYSGTNFLAGKAYSSPTKIARKEGMLKDATDHNLSLEKIWYSNVDLQNKQFSQEGNSTFQLLKPKANREDTKEVFKYKIIDSRIEHKSPTANQINGYSGSKAQEESENYHMMIKEGFGTFEQPATGFVEQLKTLENELKILRESFIRINILNRPITNNLLLTPQKITELEKISNQIGENRANFNTLLGQEYATNILAILEGITFRQIAQQASIGMLNQHYNDILNRFGQLKTFLQAQVQIGKTVFESFKNIASYLEGLDNITQNGVYINPYEKVPVIIFLQDRIQAIRTLLKHVNQEEECNGNHKTLGLLLGKKSEIVFINKNINCPSESEDHISIQETLTELENTEKIFKAKFRAYTASELGGSGSFIPGMNLLTPERPIDSPRYLSFQGVGENVVQLIYPNLFKVEMYDGNLLKTTEHPQNQVKEALITYLKNKVKEYNTLLANEKQQAKPINKHYQLLFSVDKLATPLLDTSIRPYQPFTYEEMLEALGGEKMLNTLAELLYAQSVTNYFKNSQDAIAEDIKATRENLDINRKIADTIKNYLSQNNDSFLESTKNAYHKLVLPNYSPKGYEVGYINSDENDSVITNQHLFDRDLENTPSLSVKKSGEEILDASEEILAIKKECGFDVNDALLLYNFETKKADWWEGVKCRLEEVKKKPFELKLSFEGPLVTNAPLSDNLKNNLVAPLEESRETYKQSFKQSIAFHDLDSKTERSQQIQDIFNQTQISITNKKVNVFSKTGSLDLLSLKDFGMLQLKITSTGDNCLLINQQNSCNRAITLSKNPFKNGTKIPFTLADNTIGSIALTLEICNASQQCGKEMFQLSAVPGPLHSFEIELPKNKKLLAGAYTLLPLSAYDRYHNKIQRTIDRYTIAVDKGSLIIGGVTRKSQEINDFQNLKLLYRAEEGSAGTVNFTIKDSKGKLLSSSSAQLIAGKLHLENNGKPVSALSYQIQEGQYLLTDSAGNKYPNTKRLIPITLHLKDKTNTPLTMTTNLVMGGEKGLSKFLVAKNTSNTKKTTDLSLLESNSLFIEDGKATIYIDPGYHAGEELLTFSIPGLPPQTLKLTILAGPLAKISIKTLNTAFEKNSSGTGVILLNDARGNKIQQSTTISIHKEGAMEVVPQGDIKINNGEQKFTIKTNDQGGLSQLVVSAQSSLGKIEHSQSFITKEFFLRPAINSGLNIMYLNLFGSDWGNQRAYGSSHKKLSEEIITKSEKTLAVTTQLIDPQKIKRNVLILGDKAKLDNKDQIPMTALISANQIQLQLERIGNITINEGIKQLSIIKTADADLSSLLQQDAAKALNTRVNKLFIYNLDQNFIFNNGEFSTQEGISLGKIGKDILLQRTPEIRDGYTVWQIIGKGQTLGTAIMTQVNFSNAQAEIENLNFGFGTIFFQGSTNKIAKALFANERPLNDEYQGYDSIQNSYEMEKAIGFRGHFKNITSFAGGKSVGESTLAFGSEFLINIGDPLLKRREQNKNLNNADYNQGLGKVVFSEPEKTIFKTLDIDYNSDGLRDLLVVYEDGSIKLQKQYQDKQFYDLGTLMISAEEIKEIFIGDVDGNSFEDIIIRNAKNQLRIYTNEDGVFDVDGRIACLNTNVSLGQKNEKAGSLSGVHQVFVKDMDVDGKIDVVTFDRKGYLKIFYGNGNKNNHSYLSKEVDNCDPDRYQRQEKQSKIIKTFGLQLNPKKAIRDESLIRWDGLTYPTEAAIQQHLSTKNNREKGIETDPILLKKMEDPALQASCSVQDYECKRNEYGEQFCKKYWRYNTCLPGCSAPAWPLPGERVCKQEYKEMDRQNDDQRIRGKFSYEDGMCWVAPVATCVPSGYEEEGRIDSQSKDEIVHAGGSFDFIDTAQEGVGTFDKYVRNPFEDIEIFENQEDWAFIPIKRLETPSLKPLGDKIRDVSKRYTDLNGGKLENGDLVQVEVLIVNKYATFGTGAAFFDHIHGPWIVEQDEKTQAPKNLQFKEGSATINPQTKEYAYYLTDLQFSAKDEIVYTYTLVYHMEDPLFKISIEDVEIEDYSAKPELVRSAPGDGMNKDGVPDFIIQAANDGCNKKQAILFNQRSNAKRNYRETTVDLQALSDIFAQQLTQKKSEATTDTENKIKNTQSTNTINTMPGLEDIGESYEIKNTLNTVRESLKSDGNLSIDFFSDELKEVEKNVQNVADKMCNGFSFGLANVKSCEGLPVPFNQAFLAPGNYHLMGCIPMEPLTRTLGKGIPVFHFPGTLTTPVGTIPIPWGQKGPGDEFLRIGGGVYPSWIRIYAAPTLTAQIGIAICFGPQTVGLKLPSPFSDIGGNCIVTSMPLPCGKKNESDTANEKSGTSYHAWAKNYRETTTCQLNKSDSPFIITASTLSNDALPTNLPEGSFLGGSINIDYDSITSLADSEQNGIHINGIKINGVKDLNNKIIGATQQGIMKKLVGRFDRQTQYWINNLLRFRVEFLFPDMDHLNKEISSFNMKELGKLTADGLEDTEKKLSTIEEKNLKTLTQNMRNSLNSREKLTTLNLSNGDNPFEKLQEFFNNKELVNLRSQNITVKIPRIPSEDLEAYANYLKTWLETNGEVLDARIQMASAVILSCEAELKDLQGTAFKEKQASCKILQESKNQLMQMQSTFDKTSEQIYQNIQTLELYKRFPLEIYERLHISDKYLGEISALISNFFGYINYWMEVNANRFSQYTDAIITMISVIKTYQVMVDLFVDWGKKCGKCSQDGYDQYACKLSFLCPDLPIIPIPSVKIPSLYIDLSHLNLEMDIVLPRFTFVHESIELPKLPNLPEPPQLGTNFKVDFKIPDIPQLPEPPHLPELPSFIPQVKMQLPILPPAPKIPEVPNQLTKTLQLAKTASKIFCIIKSGIGLVGENAVKARIEQMTQRSYNVPWVDNLDLTHLFKQAPLQGIDIQADSYVNLQYNFDGFYAFLKDIVDSINQTSSHLVSQYQTASEATEDLLEQATNPSHQISNPLQVNTEILSYQSQTENIKKQLLSFQNSTLNEQEKIKFAPIISLLSTDSKIKKNENGFSKIASELNTIIQNEKTQLTTLAELAKNDYTRFLAAANVYTEKTPIQRSFSASLLAKNEPIQKTIAGVNPLQTLIEGQEQQIDGYLNALTTNTPESLNMEKYQYEKSKQYLANIKSKIGEWKSLKTTSYAGTQLLTTHKGATTARPLLTQSNNRLPKTISTATTDLSDYIKGVLVKGHDNNQVNVVYSKYNYEQFPSYYQQDLNNDKKTDLIMRDAHNIYVKYANDAESYKNQEHRNYYVLSPQLKNASKKYENLKSSFFLGSQAVKLYDENEEVKNFKLGGQTFDTLSFSWTHNHANNIDGYLMRISERIDGLLEKNDLNNAKYLLFLPLNTDTNKSTLTLNGEKDSLENWLKKKKIYEILYYNPAKEELQFDLHEVPRKWQYLQITSLISTKNHYEQNAPWSNQVVGGRQIIGDEEAPKARVELIRSKTSAVVDEGLDLEGFVGTYYDLKIIWSDNVKVANASISSQEGKLIKEAQINAQEGAMIIKEQPFRQASEKTYHISAKDSEGNESTEEITLTIRVPEITIEHIEQYSGRKEGIEQPILITSELETDIDEGTVSFERKRKTQTSIITARLNGKDQQTYPVSTNITTITGAYYDFGELIGLYAQNNALYATVNGKNGEILIQPNYQKELNLGLDFSKGYPVIKVLKQGIPLFEIILKSEQIIKKQLHKGTLQALSGSQYGNFNGGEVVILGKEPLLYISENGSLRSNKPLQGKYHFDKQKQLVIYEIFENAFGEPLMTITFKAKAL